MFLQFRRCIVDFLDHKKYFLKKFGWVRSQKNNSATKCGRSDKKKISVPK